MRLSHRFHPSKGSTVAQWFTEVDRKETNIRVSIPQRVQPWPRLRWCVPDRCHQRDVSIPQRVQPWPRRSWGAMLCSSWFCFHPSKGSTVAQVSNSVLAMVARENCFHPSKGSTVAQPAPTRQCNALNLLFPSLKGFNRGPVAAFFLSKPIFTGCFHPSKGSTVAQCNAVRILPDGVFGCFHPSKGSTVAQVGASFWVTTAEDTVSIPQRVQPWPSHGNFPNRRTGNCCFHPSKGSTVAQLRLWWRFE